MEKMKKVFRRFEKWAVRGLFLDSVERAIENAAGASVARSRRERYRECAYDRQAEEFLRRAVAYAARI